MSAGNESSGAGGSCAAKCCWSELKKLESATSPVPPGENSCATCGNTSPSWNRFAAAWAEGGTETWKRSFRTSQNDVFSSIRPSPGASGAGSVIRPRSVAAMIESGTAPDRTARQSP
eukprot:CAMPEP_0180407046 /NCGR_PEP_ID=MMETSP0989-20121125/41506_1 /TAXON_ID=697907 /ORGANISM="non described non described, Strain CCMP2293" /LENGTH=116 /DNA_ID=CAMNT_0022410835 /DNA_START=509 /DNA_END=856 /DNA_ORIENTATION=-